MKKYQSPEIRIVEINVHDIIATSIGIGDPASNGMSGDAPYRSIFSEDLLSEEDIDY